MTHTPESGSSHSTKRRRNLPYIEPTIRVIAGFLLTVIGLLIYRQFDLTLMLAILFFISLNLLQSGFTHFCMMEKILKFFGFRSEIAEITALSEEAQRSAAMQKNYMRTLNLLNEAVLELSPQGAILSASDGWYRLVGNNITREQTLGQAFVSLIHADDRERVATELQKTLDAEDQTHTVRFRFTGDNEVEQWIGGKFLLERLSDELRIRGVLRDITDAYLQERQIKHMALHDALTGLPNRVLLDEQLDSAISRANRNQTPLGLLFIDLDNFKQVNDVHGHKVGDNLLVSVSRIMQLRLRNSDTLARWGGDEFVVVLPDLKHATDIRMVAESLMHELESELRAEGFDAIVTLSIGGAIYPDDADSSETLLVQADKALYFAKEQGRNNVQIYTELRNSNLGYYDFDMTNRFSQAIKEGKIEVHYQPLVTATEQRISGFEALARWQDEKYGWVSPGTFIPMAENLGLIQELGRLVITRAVADFASLPPMSDLVLSVNLSNRQLMQGDFKQCVTRLAEEHAVAPARIKLEITESIAQLGIVRAKEILESLRDAGFRISLDDFGTGYSSLSHLHNLPVQELKIDMSFVKRYEEKEGRVMLETICAMGHSLGLELVAEGVETRECAETMRKLGANRLQGYYFSKPLPWHEASRLPSTGPFG